MKAKFIMLCFISFTITQAQHANRFFYELTFKPKKASEIRDKVMTILDITDKKSLYEDFTRRSQDSIVKNVIETSQKSGKKYDLSEYIKDSKFYHKITKLYDIVGQQYIIDMVGDSFFSYYDNISFKWKILNEKEKIGEYNTQKATTKFGGRRWTAWFSLELPFQDGPYKFYGLPGLIVKIEDFYKNYSWVLQGNKKVENYDEISYTQRVLEKEGISFSILPTTKEKFQKVLDSYKSDPLRVLRSKLTPEMMSEMIPGENKTVEEIFKEEEIKEKERLATIDNPIELPSK